VSDLDVIVVGSGVAGLSIAQRLDATSMSVALVTKATVSDSTTRWAQGGVAAVMGSDEDSLDLHIADTLSAGAGLCDFDAVQILIEEGPLRVADLIDLGAMFDRNDGGSLALAREGGHSHARVLHAGGAATGVEVQRTLVDAIRSSNASIVEHHFATELLVGDDGVEGLRTLTREGTWRELRARHVVLATGGAGQLFAVTTNPNEATGDGVALALRAQVPVADVEFMQFHPTALHAEISPRPLLSEALRGHGALLLDGEGERFVDELAPRDVVARAMASTMASQQLDHVWLDATALDRFAERFPSLSVRLQEVGLDPSRDWIPVAPAAHHWAGGVMTDVDGATMLDGLWAAGEVSDSGVHGANRLASNSLLEGLVFGARVAAAISGGGRGPAPTGVVRPLFAADLGGMPLVDAPATPVTEGPGGPAATLGTTDGIALARAALQESMTRNAGVVRSAKGLAQARALVEQIDRALETTITTFDGAELANLATCARALLSSATTRIESRGSHTREEYPDVDPVWERRIVHRSPGQGER
jgi:L-aspartate oxidase